MILSIVAGGALAEITKFGVSTVFEGKAIKKYVEAYGKSAGAERMVLNKSAMVDDKLQAVLNKKKAIRDYTIPMYIETYEQIKDIEREGSDFLNTENYGMQLKEISTLNYLKESSKATYTDKELLLGGLTFGFGNMAILNSKKMLSTAKIQMSNANVQYSEAETIICVLDAVEQQAIRVSKVLAMLNRLTIGILSNVKVIVEKNGNIPDNYTEHELELLTLCENMVLGLVDLLNIPVINKDGIVEKSAVELLNNAEVKVSSFKQLLEGKM